MGINFNELPAKVQDRIRRDNPDVFRPMEARVAEPNRERGVQNQEPEKRENGVRFCITLIAIRRRLLDSHDNARSALKPLVDRITEWLGFRSDSDERLIWEYGQQKTEGTEGVMVKIEYR